MSYEGSLAHSDQKVKECASVNANFFGLKKKLNTDPDRPPASVALDPTGLPDVFRENPRCVEFRYAWDPKKKKWDKLPFCSRPGDMQGRKVGPNDASHWSTLDEALAQVEETRKGAEVAYPGFAVGELPDGRTVSLADLDDIRNPETGEIQPWALAEVHKLNSYTEVSASGTGLHVFVFGKLPPGGRKCKAVEMYDCARGVMLTGHRLEGTPAQIQDRQAELAEMHGRYFPATPAKSGPITTAAAEQNPARPAASNYSYLTDEEVIEKVMTEGAGKFAAAFDNPAAFRAAYGDNESEADMALALKLAFYTGGNPDRIEQIMRNQSALAADRPKWDRPTAGKTWLRYSIDKALAKKWKGKVYSGTKPAGTKAEPSEAYVSLDSIKSEIKEFLIDGLIPLGELIMVEGPPAMGKTQLTFWMAAHVTSGRPAPWAPAGTPAREPGGVLILKAEDDFASSIRPRMELAGVDVSRVIVRKAAKAVDLARDLKEIRAVVKNKGIKLIIIDGFFSTTGSANMNDTTESRQVLDPVVDMAREEGIAVVAVRHIVKGRKDRDLASLGGGNTSVSALGRTQILVGESNLEPGLHGAKVTKENVGAITDTLTFRRLTKDTPVGKHPVLEFTGVKPQGQAEFAAEFLPATVDELSRSQGRPGRGRPDDQKEQAKMFLRGRLAGGAVMKAEVERGAKEAGISEKTLERAAQELGVESHRKFGPDNPYGKATWSLAGAHGDSDGTTTPEEKLSFFRPLKIVYQDGRVWKSREFNFDGTTTPPDQPPPSSSRQNSHGLPPAAAWIPAELNGTH